MYFEKKAYQVNETPLKILNFKYPGNENHDAEALAIHPETGDIFVITKVLVRQTDEDDKDTSYSGPSKVFKLAKNQWAKLSAEDPVMTYVGQIDLDPLARLGVKKRYMHQAITGLDISEDGKKFILLTYRDLFEVSLDLSSADKNDLAKLELGKNVSRIEIEKPERLIQQEAVAYTAEGDIIYTTEILKGEYDDENFAPNIMSVGCDSTQPLAIPMP